MGFPLRHQILSGKEREESALSSTALANIGGNKFAEELFLSFFGDRGSMYDLVLKL